MAIEVDTAQRGAESEQERKKRWNKEWEEWETRSNGSKGRLLSTTALSSETSMRRCVDVLYGCFLRMFCISFVQIESSVCVCVRVKSVHGWNGMHVEGKEKGSRDVWAANDR